MKLIFFYGPPASGKLTIAEELSKKTSIALFHNHLSRDIVKDIYNDKLSENYDLVDKIRLDVISHCAKRGTNLIFTYVYEGKDDDKNVKLFIDTVKKNNGVVEFVELTANPEDLVARVDNQSRKKFKKLTDPEIMKSLIEDMDKYSIPFVNPLRINTSLNSVDEAVEKIVEKIC